MQSTPTVDKTPNKTQLTLTVDVTPSNTHLLLTTQQSDDMKPHLIVALPVAHTLYIATLMIFNTIDYLTATFIHKRDDSNIGDEFNAFEDFGAYVKQL